MDELWRRSNRVKSIDASQSSNPEVASTMVDNQAAAHERKSVGSMSHQSMVEQKSMWSRRSVRWEAERGAGIGMGSQRTSFAHSDQVYSYTQAMSGRIISRWRSDEWIWERCGACRDARVAMSYDPHASLSVARCR